MNAAIVPRGKLYSVPDLKIRGWTDTAIRRYLPAPDDTRPNPYYSQAGAPMRFWLKTRIHRAEKTKRFQTWRAGADARSEAALKAAATRGENMAVRMETVEIKIERGWKSEQIEKLARQTHGGNYMGDPGPFCWSNRTAHNCIRHNLTNYEQLWSLTNRGDTGRLAYEVLRERVDALIDEVYPQFKTEEVDHVCG